MKFGFYLEHDPDVFHVGAAFIVDYVEPKDLGLVLGFASWSLLIGWRDK